MSSAQDPQNYLYNVRDTPEVCLARLENRIVALEAFRQDTVRDITELDQRLQDCVEKDAPPSEGSSEEFTSGITARLSAVYQTLEDLESFLLNR